MNYWLAIKGLTNITEIPTYNDDNNNRYDSIGSGQMRVIYSRDGRFKNDQLFKSDSNSLTIIDGVLLNLEELKRKYACDTLEAILEKIDREKTFFSEFRGPFSGIFYNSANDSIVAFGNQTGDSPIFYYKDSVRLLISNDFNLLVDVIKRNKIGIKFDEKAALYLMTYGYMLDESTLVQEIKRLSAGKYIYSDDASFNVLRYHQFNYKDKEISFEQAIEAIESGFNKAVSRCFNKDLEYGIEYHLADMSGGLDSRMVSFAAKKLGYNRIVNISYSQSGSDEQKYASMVSKELGNEFIHKQLDDAGFLFEVDDIIKLNYGLTYYFGITGGRQLLSSINKEKFGLEHTGQLGDVIIGSFGNTSEHVPPIRGSSRNSKLIEFEPSDEYYGQYQDNEDFTFENRGFRSVLSTHLTRRHYFYAVSPFIDIDFMEICFSIPMSYRINHKLYWAWLDKYYPDATIIPSTRKKEENSTQILVNRARRYLKRTTKKIGHVIGLSKTSNVENHMNPFEFWYETSDNLREFIDTYYSENITLLKPYDETFENVKKLYSSSRTVDKLIALSVLGGIKQFFGQ